MFLSTFDAKNERSLLKTKSFFLMNKFMINILVIKRSDEQIDQGTGRFESALRSEMVRVS